ncbi:hypothetical protein VUR80DRAFT_1212 [Thermomyces stellatus]
MTVIALPTILRIPPRVTLIKMASCVDRPSRPNFLRLKRPALPDEKSWPRRRMRACASRCIGPWAYSERLSTKELGLRAAEAVVYPRPSPASDRAIHKAHRSPFATGACGSGKSLTSRVFWVETAAGSTMSGWLPVILRCRELCFFVESSLSCDGIITVAPVWKGNLIRPDAAASLSSGSERQ